MVIGFDGAVGRASARTTTTGDVNLYEALAATAQHLVRFGGHAGAAGLTLELDKLDPFRAAFLTEVERRRGRAGSELGREIEVDAEIDLHEIDVAFTEELGRLAPYGAGNREPLFALRGLVTADTRVVGQGHLQLSVTGGRARGEAIAFNMAGLDPGAGAMVDLLAHADLDTYRGNRRARLRVRHLRRAAETTDVAVPAADEVTSLLGAGAVEAVAE